MMSHFELRGATGTDWHVASATLLRTYLYFDAMRGGVGGEAVDQDLDSGQTNDSTSET